MARKSNKTAHVLNLLAGHDSSQPAADEAPDTTPSVKTSADAASSEVSVEAASPEASASAKPAEAETVASAASVQNISVIDTTGEDPVADLIQQKLSAQFEEPVSNTSEVLNDDSMDEDSSAKVIESANDVSDSDNSANGGGSSSLSGFADTPAVPDTADSYSIETVSDNVTVPTPEPAPAPAPVSVPTPEPVPSIPIPDPESVPGPGPTTVPKQEPVPESEPEPDFVYVNIMESIVKDKIIYFMRQFDVCTCDRCVADTIALTMNGLIPRYIVTSPAAVDPLISFYTNKLISDVTVEATKACIIVKDNPRH